MLFVVPAVCNVDSCYHVHTLFGILVCTVITLEQFSLATTNTSLFKRCTSMGQGMFYH